MNVIRLSLEPVTYRDIIGYTRMSDHIPVMFVINVSILVALSKCTRGYTLAKNLFHVIFQAVEDALQR